MDLVNVRELIGLDTSVTADSVAIAFTTIKQLKPRAIYFPAGVYPVLESLTIPVETCAVYGDGADATLIDASSASPSSIDHAVLYAPRGEVLDLNAKFSTPPVRHDKVLHCQMPLLVPVPGDVIILHDKRPNSYADMNLPQQRDYHAGEFLHVVAIDVAQGLIHLSGGIQGQYTDATSLLLGLMPRSSSLTIRDLSVIGTGQVQSKEACIYIENGRDVSIQNVKLMGAFDTLCAISHCIDCVVDNIAGDQVLFLSKINNPKDVGEQYGVGIFDSQNVTVTRSTLATIRHAVTIGGNTPPWSVVNRQIRISECCLTTLYPFDGPMGAIDAHGNSEYFAFVNNRVFGPINLSGRYGCIRGNEIFSSGLGVFGDELMSLEHEIADNLMHCVSIAAGEGTLLGVVEIVIRDYTNHGAGPLLFLRNRVVAASSDGTIITAFNQAISTDFQFVVTDNDLFSDRQFGTRPSVFRVRGTSVSNVIIKRNILRQCRAGLPGDVLDTNPDNFRDNTIL